MASVGSILNGAFRLLKDEPVTVAIWAGIFIAYTVGSSALALSGLAFDAEALRSGAVSPMNAIGLGLALAVVALLFVSVMSCAVYRAVLRPEEGGFAWLRLGSDEFRMAGLYILMTFIIAFLGLILGLGFFFVAGGSALMTGGGGGSIGIAILLAVICGLFFIYASIRVSLIFPMTFLRRQISIDEGWGLSRGRFWTLFLAYLVIGIIMLVINMFIPGIPGQPDFFSTIRSLQDPGAREAIEGQQLAAAASATILTMLPYLLLASVVQIFSHVVSNSASATAVREFLRDDGEVLDGDVERTAQIFE